MGTVVSWIGANAARKSRYSMISFLVPPYWIGAPTGTRLIRENTIAAWKKAWE